MDLFWNGSKSESCNVWIVDSVEPEMTRIPDDGSAPFGEVTDGGNALEDEVTLTRPRLG